MSRYLDIARRVIAELESARPDESPPSQPNAEHQATDFRTRAGSKLPVEGFSPANPASSSSRTGTTRSKRRPQDRLKDWFPAAENCADCRELRESGSSNPCPIHRPM